MILRAVFSMASKGQGLRQRHQPKEESSTPSSNKWRPCRFSKVKIARWRIFSQQLALEELWSSQERSWLIVRPKSYLESRWEDLPDCPFWEIRWVCAFLLVERHIPSVGPSPESIKVCREGRGCCLPVWRMRNDTAEGEIISKEIGRHFYGIGMIILDEDEEQDWAQDTVFGHSNLDRERWLKDSIESHTLNTGVEEVSDTWKLVALDATSRKLKLQTFNWKTQKFKLKNVGCQTISNIRCDVYFCRHFFAFSIKIYT